MQHTPFRKSWRNGFGPTMLMVASLFVLAGVVPTALASLPAPTQRYTFKTVDAPGDATATGFLLTWVNDSGLVIQQYIDANGFFHTAALLHNVWTVIDVPGAANTGATNPNSQGQVALSYWGADNVYHLAIWQKGHYTYVTDPCPGYVFWGANGINDLGQVTSLVSDATYTTFLAYVGDSKHHTVLAYPGSTFTCPFMTNDRGVMVGDYYDSAGVQHGFVYDIQSGMQLSVDVPGGAGTILADVNNEGEIVGNYFRESGGNAFGVVIQRLNLTAFDVPGSEAVTLSFITANHTIAGSYLATDGKNHGFVATPVDRE